MIRPAGVVAANCRLSLFFLLNLPSCGTVKTPHITAGEWTLSPRCCAVNKTAAWRTYSSQVRLALENKWLRDQFFRLRFFHFLFLGGSLSGQLFSGFDYWFPWKIYIDIDDCASNNCSRSGTVKRRLASWQWKMLLSFLCSVLLRFGLACWERKKISCLQSVES